MTKFRYIIILILGLLVFNSAKAQFITTWKTTDGSISIPTEGSGYNYNISWKDLTTSTPLGSASGITGNYTISGLINGDSIEVSITGTFPRIRMDGYSTNDPKLYDVVQWGNIQWTSFRYAFSGCKHLKITATDLPDLSNVLDLSYCFEGDTALNSPNISNWDVSNVTNLTELFQNATSFNQPLNSWNVSNVTSLFETFKNATSFNQSLNNWDVSNVTNMNRTFRYATSFKVISQIGIRYPLPI